MGVEGVQTASNFELGQSGDLRKYTSFQFDDALAGQRRIDGDPYCRKLLAPGSRNSVRCARLGLGFRGLGVQGLGWVLIGFRGYTLLSKSFIQSHSSLFPTLSPEPAGRQNSHPTLNP